MPLTIPNLLSLFRIAAAPFLLLAAWFGSSKLFFFIFGAMLLSDLLDGFIARALNQTSELGARLDSYGDILTYLTVPFAVWFLWPEIILHEKAYIITAVVLYILPALFSFFKFGKLATYHTWITKLSALLMSLGMIVLLLFHQPLLFHISVWFLIIETIENITITLILHTPASNIRSIGHALNLRRFRSSQKRED
ncbi:MAG: CDP-alcohol phosphatidyltransferase family protein [Sulfurospirillum sp.]|nr:MAG: CDP-alcohol phosphatidyltransferase family protein [Sulfurospirillum sp.]